MNRLPYLLFALTLVIAASVVAVSSSAMPAVVASHFNAGGEPNAWGPRASYLALILGVTVGLPLLIVASMAWLPRASPRRVNIPNRDYWLAEPQREQTFASLQAFACAMGIAVALFCMGVHLLVVSANLSADKQLANGPFIALLAIFVLIMSAWTVLLLRRFRRPDR